MAWMLARGGTLMFENPDYPERTHLSKRTTAFILPQTTTVDPGDLTLVAALLCPYDLEYSHIRKCAYLLSEKMYFQIITYLSIANHNCKQVRNLNEVIAIFCTTFLWTSYLRGVFFFSDITQLNVSMTVQIIMFMSDNEIPKTILCLACIYIMIKISILGYVYVSKYM